MVHQINYEKMGGYATKITPRPPFFLFVPSINEIPPAIKKENKGKAFVFGKFFDSDRMAQIEVKKAGYGEKKTRILKAQGYFRLKGEW